MRKFSRSSRRPMRKLLRRRRPKRMPNVQQQRKPFLSGMSLGQLASYAAKGVSMMSGIINSELKRFDSINDFNPSSTLPTFYCLNQIAQGTDVSNRDGNSILAKYITVNYSTIIHPSAVATIVRVICFVDTESISGTTPTINTLLNGSTVTTNSQLNVDYTNRYTILFDDKINLSNTGEKLQSIKHYKPLNFHIKFTQDSTTSWSKNSVWLLMYSNEDTNTPTLDLNARMAFYDN